MKKIIFFMILIAAACVLTACPASSAPSSDIVSVTSTSSTTALISFTQELTDSATNKDNYEITSETEGGQITKLIVLAASLSDNAKQVTLSTLTQSQVTYKVTISNVMTKSNKAIDSTKNNSFVGTAGTGSAADFDGDGLSDAQEQQGWTVRIKNADAEVETYLTTSDPSLADTDEDGIDDGEELAKSSDPRKADTDGDGLSDAQELITFNSDASNRDSDKDGLSDGDEINKHKTSPILSDTDSDQLDDNYEVATANRNPRIADLPEPLIDVDSLSLGLNITLQETKSTGSIALESNTVSATFSEGISKSNSTSDSSTDGWHATASVSYGSELEFKGPIPTAKVSSQFTAEAGLSGSNTFTVDKASTTEAQETYETASTTEKQLSKDATFSKEVSEGYISALVNINNLSDIAFTIEKLQIIALVQSATNPTQFEHLATLNFKKVGNNEFFSASVGPNAQVGPYAFEDDGAFPNVVEQLMRNPTTVIFKVSGYDLIDESGRKFAYVEQALNDSTAKFFIDYGTAAPFERNRIATFNATNNSGGITIIEAFEETLGLTGYDEDINPTVSLSSTEIESSYSTRNINGVETLWRVRDVARDNVVNPLKEWVVITQTGIDKSINVSDFVLRPGNDATLSFAQDKDKDGVIARIEAQRGSSDEDADSDDDGLSDREEIYEGWTIEVSKESGELAEPRAYLVFSNPTRVDSDGDGLTDTEEKALGTDPANPDTDNDRIFDKKEVDGGYTHTLADTSVITISKNETLGYATNPRDADDDNDGVQDGDELDYGGNPQVADQDLFTDTDGDGLSDRQELEGWYVTRKWVSTTVGVEGQVITSTNKMTSDPNKKNSDEDSLDDKQEFEARTDPNNKDSDYDGYNDDDPKDPDPLDYDSDNDGLSDFFEQETGWTVVVDGISRNVLSDPEKLESDRDSVNDNIEFVLKSDPKNINTDDDGALDGVEWSRRTDSNDNNDTSLTEKDQVITVLYTKFKVYDDCDAGAAGAGEWNWNLKITLPSLSAENLGETLWLHDEIGVSDSFTSGQSVDLTNDSFNVFKGVNPYTFVKKHTELFTLHGNFYESDDGTDGDSDWSFRAYYPKSKIGDALPARTEFSKDKGGSCNSQVWAVITAE